MLNIQEGKFCRVDKYHAAGYKGGGLKIGIVEGGMNKDAAKALFGDTIRDPFNLLSSNPKRINNHMQDVTSVIHDILPEAEKILLPSGYVPDDPQRGCVEGLQYAIDNDIDLINISLSSTKMYIKPIADKIHELHKKGTVTFTSGGNRWDKYTADPRAVKDMIVVGNSYLTLSENVELYSNSATSGVDIFGFGVLLVPLYGTYELTKTVVGTSFASPWVLGMAGLLRQVMDDWMDKDVLLNIFRNNAKHAKFGSVAVLPYPVLKEESEKMRIIKLHTPAQIHNGRFLVPARELVEELGGRVLWSKDRPNEGIFQFNNKVLILTNGSDKIEVHEIDASKLGL